jgi:hypothetical protein
MTKAILANVNDVNEKYPAINELLTGLNYDGINNSLLKEDIIITIDVEGYVNHVVTINGKKYRDDKFFEFIKEKIQQYEGLEITKITISVPYKTRSLVEFKIDMYAI